LIFSPAAVLKAGNLTKTAGPVTYPPYLAKKQPPNGEVSVPAAVTAAPVQKGFSAMNFSILAAPAWPRGRFIALLAATALSACLLAPGAQAQQPAPGAPAAAPKAKAAPKAAPKAPAPSAQQTPAAPPAGAPAAGAQPADQVQLIYAPWTKFCLKGQDAGAKQVCFTGKDGRIESGQPVIAAVIIEPEGEPKKILRVTLPLGMQLVHGTRVIVDSNPPQQSPYVICFQYVSYEATPELIANLKKGGLWWSRRSTQRRAAHACRWPVNSPRPMTARRPTRRCSRKPRRSSRKSCRSAPRKRARSSRPIRPPARLRPIRLPSN
jgi:invasion protein IalB